MDDIYMGYAPRDYLDALGHFGSLDRGAIEALRQERRGRLLADREAPRREAVAAIASWSSAAIDLHGETIRVGQASELSPSQLELRDQVLQAFCPWKKGPFCFFGADVDAEWRSHWKWQRILPHIGSLQGKRVADIGCHNGYFMFRMAAQDPACVVGFEPFARHYWNFQLFQHFIGHDALHFELLGVEHLHHFRGFFEQIFCLGILYHHSDPIGLLRGLHKALAPGGQIVVDCQGIPGELPVALVPERRYARARGIWFLPTQSCLEHWMRRSGFAEIQCIFASPLSTEEQRRTAWADIDSLAQFLDPEDPTRTVEGYPAPWRYYIRAHKG